MRTPCVGVCSTTLGDEVCRGCGRTVEEIRDWGAMTDAQRRRIMDRLKPSKPHIEHRKGLGWLAHAAHDTRGMDRRLQAASHFCAWLNRQEAFHYERMYYYRQLFHNERGAK